VAQTISIKRGEERIFIFMLLDKQEGLLCVLATSAFAVVWKMKTMAQ